MYIYRIEHDKLNCGPYNPDHSLDCESIWRIVLAYDNPAAHPNGFCDAGMSPDSRYYFGFKDVESLWAWFGFCLSKLTDHGYVVKIYEISPLATRKGDYQILFRMSESVHVDTMSIPDLCILCEDHYERSSRTNQLCGC